MKDISREIESANKRERERDSNRHKERVKDREKARIINSLPWKEAEIEGLREES